MAEKFVESRLRGASVGFRFYSADALSTGGGGGFVAEWSKVDECDAGRPLMKSV
jgi:hypothetical protein